ncbi:DUF1080 domain-containing protein [candidate division KSB1 bacterium]|nr:DUF1080 domain-containing protein [candidate division KSB1 bacterium]
MALALLTLNFEQSGLVFSQTSTLSSHLAQLPAPNPEEARRLNAAFVKLGPKAYKELCSMLVPMGTGDDVKARLALSGLALHVSRSGAEKERKQFAEAIIVALQSNAHAEVKTFLLRQLQLTGGKECVAALKSFLVDEKLCEPATQALLAIRAPEAELAFVQALTNSSGANRLTIIKALGELRSKAAVPELLKLARDKDRVVGGASQVALANTGELAAMPLLSEAVQSEGSPQAMTNYLLFAQRRAEAGDKQTSATICREVLANHNGRFASHEQAKALSTLVTALGAEALPDLIATMEREDVRLQDAALQRAHEISGEAATAQWVNKMKHVAPPARARITTMLGEGGDKSALPVLREALRDTNAAVALAAIPALAKLGGKESVSELLQTLFSTQSAEQITAVKVALLALPLEPHHAKMIELLPNVAAPAKIALLEALASRNTHVAFEAVAARTNDDTRSVRLAAIRALESISQPNDIPRLLDLLLAATSESEISALQKAIVTVAAQILETDKRADAVLIKQKNTTAEQQPKLLQTLARVGGTKAFEVVLVETKSSNADIRDAAIRSLADWPEPNALPELLRLAREEQELSYHVLAMRGALRLLEAAQFSSAEKLRLYREAMSLARRVDEKKLALAGLANVKSIAALDFVSTFLDEDTLSLEAALAPIKIAEPERRERRGLDGAEIVKALIGKASAPNLREKLEQHFAAQAQNNQPPEGFVALFNGRDLSGWKGLVENPVKRAQMSAEAMAAAQAKADSIMHAHWRVLEDGVLFFEGKGYQNLCTANDYGDFELLCDWKIEPNGDSGLYLRGVPQVQIWDPVQWKIGSGGLYNNQKHASKPLQIADRPTGEWNTFRIMMLGEAVTVYLNDVLVVDNVPLENFWERESPLYPTGQIELQAHNSPLYFKNIFIREIPRPKQLFSGPLFNGKDLSGWQIINGKAGTWKVENEILYTEGEGGGWLSTTREFENFKLELDFRVPAEGNSGVFLRAPHEGDPAYTGMEVQVLDDYATKWAKLKPWQYCGSVYAVQAPSERASKAANEWQHYEIICNGPRVQVTLNGKKIVDANLIEHMDKEKSHPGLKRRKGFIGLQNHSTRVEYRNILLEELE